MMNREQKITRNWLIGAAGALLIFLPWMLIDSQRSGDALARAIQNSDLTEAKRLLDNGADANTRLTHSWWWRIHNNPPPKSDPDAQLTLLMYAAKNDRADIMQLLLDYHADTERRDVSQGWTALEWAVSIPESVDVEQMLLDHGARIDETDPKRYNAVTIASSYGNFKGLKVLVEHGANLNAPPNQYGDTPLTAAKRIANKEMIAYLVSHHSS